MILKIRERLFLLTIMRIMMMTEFIEPMLMYRHHARRLLSTKRRKLSETSEVETQGIWIRAGIRARWM